MSDAKGSGGKLRLDKWLWHARFFKSRTLAAKQVTVIFDKKSTFDLCKTVDDVSAEQTPISGQAEEGSIPAKNDW